MKLSDEKSLWRRVRADGSYCSANDPRVLCGLGEHGGKVTLQPWVMETVGTLIMFEETEGNVARAMQYLT